ncbi:MAG TPA: hypothetical protein VE955_02610 [Candidatus Dormibacteraeota bacterium]|nr:hypothetical protein [Candidatus Dormibacteraeota bacterium]
MTLLRGVGEGKYGMAYTSDYVLDEALTVALVRTRRLEPAVNAGLHARLERERGPGLGADVEGG